MIVDAHPVALLLLKDDKLSTPIVDASELDRNEEFSRIRCPLCDWRPSAESRWYCEAAGTPEPFFRGCHTVWNTSTSRGRCPGCAHQWIWTSCLQCEGWSLHEDWYEEQSDRD